MNNDAHPPGRSYDEFSTAEPGSRLADYVARTDLPLDLLALLTLWLVVIPPWEVGSGTVKWIAWTARIAISVVYGIDLVIRGRQAGHPVHYAVTHPVLLASVLYPPVRVIFSFRLIRSLFRRGNLLRFLLGALVLVLNGAIIVYLLERHAPGSNIHTLGESVWWSLVTVTTVGYGDYTPVTPAGRVTACLIMGIGLITLAVVTAQVSSSFVSQAAARDQSGPPKEPAQPEVTLAELGRRLARIEELLLAAAPSSRPSPGPEGESGRQ
jgi:voltage-gated potassium channel